MTGQTLNLDNVIDRLVTVISQRVTGHRYLSIDMMLDKCGGISRSTLLSMRKAGKLPQPVEISGSPYWIESEVDLALSQRRMAY